MMEELGATRFHNATFVSVSLRRLMPIQHLGREWVDWELGVKGCKGLALVGISNEILLCSTGNL